MRNFAAEVTLCLLASLSQVQLVLAACVQTPNLCVLASRNRTCVANFTECQFPGDQFLGPNPFCKGMSRGCPQPPPDPSIPKPNFSIDKNNWCVPGPAPADALVGKTIVLEHQKGLKPNEGPACLFLPKGTTISKVWCEVWDDPSNKDIFNCTFNPRQCNRPGQSTGYWAWPTATFGPNWDSSRKQFYVCVSGYNQSDDRNRFWRIKGK